MKNPNTAWKEIASSISKKSKNAKVGHMGRKSFDQAILRMKDSDENILEPTKVIENWRFLPNDRNEFWSKVDSFQIIPQASERLIKTFKFTFNAMREDNSDMEYKGELVYDWQHYGDDDLEL